MSLSRPQPLAPNSWLDGLVTTVPGTGRVVLADDAGSGDHEFRIANDSIVRALRRLDLHPEALVH